MGFLIRRTGSNAPFMLAPHIGLISTGIRKRVDSGRAVVAHNGHLE